MCMHAVQLQAMPRRVGVTCGKACSDTELRLLLEAVLLVVVMSNPQSNSETERAVSGSSLLCLLASGGPMRA